MNNSTPGNLLTSSKKPSSPSQQSCDENFQGSHSSGDDDAASMQQVTDELNTIRYSPRAATIKAILQYSKQKESV